MIGLPPQSALAGRAVIGEILPRRARTPVVRFDSNRTFQFGAAGRQLIAISSRSRYANKLFVRSMMEPRCHRIVDDAPPVNRRRR